MTHSNKQTFHPDHQPEGQSTYSLFNVDMLERDPAANGRFEGHDESEVRELALDILTTCVPAAGNRPFYHGQKHPVIAERDDQKIPVLVAGYGRANAIDWINANVDDADVKSHLERLSLLGPDGKLIKPFPIKVAIAPRMNAQDRVLFNVGENAKRKPLSPMDWAVVIKKFVDQGLTDAQICALLMPYRPTGKVGEIHPTWIGQHRALLMLSPELQKRVHSGEIPVHRAGEIYRNAKEMTDGETGEKLTGEALSEEMDRQIKAVIKEDGTVDGAKLRANNRVQSAARGSKSTMTIAELKVVLNQSIAETGSTVAKALLEIIESKRTLEQAYSFLADFGPEDFKPAGDAAPSTGKRGKGPKTPAAPAATPEPASTGKGRGKRGNKVGVNAPTPVVGGVAPVAADPSAATPAANVDANGVRLPPKRTGGRTKRNVAPVAADAQTTLDVSAPADVAPVAEVSAEIAPEQADSSDVAPADAAGSESEQEPAPVLPDSADDVDPEPVF